MSGTLECPECLQSVSDNEASFQAFILRVSPECLQSVSDNEASYLAFILRVSRVSPECL